MLDLFCGRGGASAAMRARGWHVTGVDIEPRFVPDVCADVSKLVVLGSYDFVWASPPCTEFARESMPWCRTGKPPSVDLVVASARIIQQIKPRYWALENVRGSLRYIMPILGPWSHHVGPLFIWGSMPPALALPKCLPYKHRYSGRRADMRSMVPLEVSMAFAVAVEAATIESRSGA